MQILKKMNKIIDRKYWNKQTSGTAIPEDQPIFKKVAPEHIEGSESNDASKISIKDLVLIPSCYTVDPFIKKP